MLKPDLGLPGRTPPPARGGCRHVSLMVFLFTVGGLVALGAVAFLYLRQQQDQARAEFAPPTVLVTEPVSGALAYAGSYLSVSATAFGSRPITRVELWMDGQLVKKQESGRPEGDSTFYAHFSVLIPSEGPHSFSVRAVNALGIIGKSLPISVVGAPRPGPGEVFYAVRVKPGETLANIAKSYETDSATLQKVNPDLGGQEPVADTLIKVPVPPKKGEEAPVPSPPPPPVPGSSPVQIPDVPMLTVIEPLPLGIDLSRLVVPYTYPAPPDAPKDLQGQVVGCDVMLHWNDFSTNETRYEVWMALGMLSPQLVAELKPSPGKGPAWYDFVAPQTGWVTFWVEAVNPTGKQPSNEIGLFIDPQKCAWAKGSGLYLIVQVFEMTVNSNYDKVYCYVSYEGTPERKIPEKDFIQVKAGKADFGGTSVGPMVPGPNSKLVPVPQDGALDVEGRCFGWTVEANLTSLLIDLGPFAGKYAVNDWDGARRKVKGASYEIEFAIKPWTPAVEAAMTGVYWYEDPTLHAPYDLKFSSIPVKDPRQGVLVWKWDGVVTPGFQVFVNGIRYGYFDWYSASGNFLLFVPPGSPPQSASHTLQATVLSPAYCGKQVRWEVAAVSAPAQSPRSAALEYALPECQLLAQVTFKDFNTRGEDCDLGVSYEIWANNASKSFWGGNLSVPVRCGPNTFKALSGWPSYNNYPPLNVPDVDAIIVPLSGQSPSLRFGTDFFYHTGGWFNDIVPFMNKEWDLSMSPEKWENSNQDFNHCETYTSDPSGGFCVTVNVRGFRAYWKK